MLRDNSKRIKPPVSLSLSLYIYIYIYIYIYREREREREIERERDRGFNPPTVVSKHGLFRLLHVASVQCNRGSSNLVLD